VLRTAFDVFQKELGSSLDGLSTAVWAVGLVIVAFQVLAPFARVALELAMSRWGVEQTWMVNCGCGAYRGAAGDACPNCGAKLTVPAFLRPFIKYRRPSPLRRRASWLVSLLGGMAFLFGSLMLLSVSPNGSLERLFLGASLLAWAAFGMFIGRAFGPRGGGPVARTREFVCALGALAVLSSTAFLQNTVHPEAERVLAVVQASADSVEIDFGAKLATAGSQLGLELQLVEWPAMGLARVVPLGWVGATRSPIELERSDTVLRDYTWKHADSLLKLGVQVKRRTETFPMAAGSRYEVVLREKDVIIRPRAATK
jgi:hypothetical protein